MKSIWHYKKAFDRYQQKLGVAGTLTYAWRRLTTPAGNLIPVKIKGGGKVYLRNKYYDTKIFSQIFIYEELNFHLSHVPKTIIDCGANIGLATLYFKFKYPQVRIVSVEPESSNFALLKKNTAAYDNIHLINKGIWSKSGTLYLVDGGEGHASFQVSESKPQNNVIGEISAISIEEIIESFNIAKIDLLKMDIEGSEFVCFSHDYENWLSKTDCVAIEIHEHMRPGCKALIDRSLAHLTHACNGEYDVYSKTTVV